MTTNFRRSFVVFGASLCLSGFVSALDTQDTRLLTQPAITKTHIAFVYADDLWVADPDGRNVVHLTTDLGVEGYPAFSPDGSLLAFSAQYDGNTDVYVVPATGGVPKRLTWHPGADLVQDFSRDGRSILFASPRASFTGAHLQLYTVPVQGGFPERLRVPYAARAVFSPDGKKIAYNPLPDAFTEWKNYRGGRNSVIWIIDLGDASIEKVPQPEGRPNDPGPMWIGDRLYFRSDRNGEFNLFSFDPKSLETQQLTRFTDYPILNASAGGGKIIFEQAGRLHIFDPQSGKTTRLAIGVATDLAEVRERFARGASWIRNASLSPSGARAVFGFRGEIVTVPAEKGDPRNITLSPGVNDRSPVWSPDGKTIAFFSDESGEYELCLRSQDGQGEVKRWRMSGAGFYDSPEWSPDSRKIAFADNSRSLFWIDVQTGAVKKIASESLNGPMRSPTMYSSWSPDSKWIAYTLGSRTYIQRVHLYSLDRDKSFPVTSGMSDVSEPVFDSSGKYLYFFGSTDAGPVKQWFDLSRGELRMTDSLYVAALTTDAPNPLAKENDEEKGSAAETSAPVKGAEATPAAKPAAPAEKAKEAGLKPVEATRIDFDGLDRRILALSVPAGNYSDLQAGEPGQIYYLENPTPPGLPAGGPPPGSGGSTLHKYDFRARKDEVVLGGVAGYDLSADKKKILYEASTNFFITALMPKPQPGQGKLDVEAIEVRVDPRAEWQEIFEEAWRINRDYFYATNMHGADWPAMKKKYRVFLPDLSCRSDLNRVIQWLGSELAVGHHRVGGGDIPSGTRRVPGGLLGADYAVENGRYKFEKVYGGLNWNPELRAPLTEPGVDVKDGEFLLAVAGKDLRAPDNLYARFENTAGKIVELTVGPNAEGSGSRTVRVVPIESESNLRNRDWVEGNLRKVEAATAGRVAYVYVPNTSTLGLIYFRRYFYPQADKDAIIVDERFNGGGSVADYYIDHLRKPLISFWSMRYGGDLKTPGAAIEGPKAMIIDEMAGSGGDLLPLDVQEVQGGDARREEDLGRLGGNARLSLSHGRGNGDRPEPRVLDRGRLDRRKRRRGARRRGRTDSRRGDRRPRSPARKSDSADARRTEEKSPEKARAAALSCADQMIRAASPLKEPAGCPDSGLSLTRVPGRGYPCPSPPGA